jgi:uncharacterized protein (DUF58 family)
VALCGEAAKGDYVCTLDAVDLATFWVEQITPKGRGQHAVQDALKAIKEAPCRSPSWALTRTTIAPSSML